MILYLGTDPSEYLGKRVLHLPLIRISPRSIPAEILSEFHFFTHLLLTSPNAVRVLITQLQKKEKALLHEKKLFAIGKKTAMTAEQFGFEVEGIASPETQEGMVELLKTVDWQNGYVFYPRSSSARAVLASFLQKHQIKHQLCDLYDPLFETPSSKPSLDAIEEIVFTSPSTVRAFIALYGTIPQDKKLTCIGPITEKALQEVR